MPELYPITLPGVQLASLRVKEQSSVRTDDSEIGPATYELLSLDGPTDFDVQWLFFPFSFQVFEGWWRYSLLKGTNSFDIDLPVGAGIKTHECNFLNGYSETRLGRKILVSAVLRAVAKVYITEPQFNDILVLANAIPERNKIPLIRSTLEFVVSDLPGSWQDIDYGQDYLDAIGACPLITTTPIGTPDFDFGSVTFPLDTTSTAVAIDGCDVKIWRADILPDPATVLIKFHIAAPPLPDGLYNIYVFDPAGTLRGSIIGVQISTGEITFEYTELLIAGVWILAITGKTNSFDAPNGLSVRLVISNV